MCILCKRLLQVVIVFRTLYLTDVLNILKDRTDSQNVVCNCVLIVYTFISFSTGFRSNSSYRQAAFNWALAPNRVCGSCKWQIFDSGATCCWNDYTGKMTCNCPSTIKFAQTKFCTWLFELTTVWQSNYFQPS